MYLFRDQQPTPAALSTYLAGLGAGGRAPVELPTGRVRGTPPPGEQADLPATLPARTPPPGTPDPNRGAGPPVPSVIAWGGQLSQARADAEAAPVIPTACCAGAASVFHRSVVTTVVKPEIRMAEAAGGLGRLGAGVRAAPRLGPTVRADTEAAPVIPTACSAGAASVFVRSAGTAAIPRQA